MGNIHLSAGSSSMMRFRYWILVYLCARVQKRGLSEAVNNGWKRASLTRTPSVCNGSRAIRCRQRVGGSFQSLRGGAKDAKPTSREDLPAAVHSRLARRKAHSDEMASAKSPVGFNPDFASSKPLQIQGITAGESEVLLWVAQGKSNGDIAILPGMAEKTVKKQMGNISQNLDWKIATPPRFMRWKY